MSYARALRGLLSADARRVARDRFLLAAAAYLLGMAVVMRWVLPWMARAVRSRWSLELEPYYPLIVSYLVVVLGSVAVGIVGGFILLESSQALRLIPAHADASVVAPEPEAVGERVSYAVLARFVGDEVEVTLGVGVVVIDGGRYYAALDSHGRHG